MQQTRSICCTQNTFLPTVLPHTNTNYTHTNLVFYSDRLHTNRMCLSTLANPDSPYVPDNRTQLSVLVTPLLSGDIPRGFSMCLQIGVATLDVHLFLGHRSFRSEEFRPLKRFDCGHIFALRGPLQKW